MVNIVSPSVDGSWAGLGWKWAWSWDRVPTESVPDFREGHSATEPLLPVPAVNLALLVGKNIASGVEGLPTPQNSASCPGLQAGTGSG